MLNLVSPPSCTFYSWVELRACNYRLGVVRCVMLAFSLSNLTLVRIMSDGRFLLSVELGFEISNDTQVVTTKWPCESAVNFQVV
jgi:hypothetical protein